MPGEARQPVPLEARVAFLEGRVAALERALARRSHELRLLQGVLCPDDLLRLSLIAAGLAPEGRLPHLPELWQETWSVEASDVETAMTALWDALRPVADELPPSP